MAELLTGLEITGYRQFERFTMDGLRRVNLLVGKNNSGKTALLEAVQILTTRPVLGALEDVLIRRGELEAASGSNLQGTDIFPSLRHLFPGHRLSPSGGSISIRSTKPERFVDLNTSTGWTGGHVSTFGFAAGATLTIHDEQALEAMNHQAYPLSPNGLFEGYAYRHEFPTTRFVGVDGLSRDEMARLYDLMVEVGRESNVASSLQILTPSIKDVHFRSTVHASRLDEGSSVIIGYSDGGRHPLGSAGEGMRRMLGLSLALNSVKGGVLLIDEIDTGLHYSVMGDLWRLVVETARRLDVQVFATTHSKDCVEGLEFMRAKAPDLFEEVAVHTIDVRRGRSVVAAGERLEDAVQLGVELR